MSDKNPDKGPGGRPTKYRPEYCEQVIQMGKEGKSVAQWCSQFEICRFTIDQWCKDYPEFSDAFTRARSEMQAHLERMGYEGLGSKDFNANLFKITMQARFREDYTERREVKNSGQVVVISPDAAKL